MLSIVKLELFKYFSQCFITLSSCCLLLRMELELTVRGLGDQCIDQYILSQLLAYLIYYSTSLIISSNYLFSFHNATFHDASFPANILCTGTLGGHLSTDLALRYNLDLGTSPCFTIHGFISIKPVTILLIINLRFSSGLLSVESSTSVMKFYDQ